MKRKLLFVLFFLIIAGIVPLLAQYKVKTERFEPDKVYGSGASFDRAAAFVPGEFQEGQYITYTPQFGVNKGEMFTSGHQLSFQEVDKHYYIYTEYIAWDTPNLDPSYILTVEFNFKDGSQLLVNATMPFNTLQIAVPAYGGSWTYYSVRSKVTKEQLEIFTKLQLLSIGYNLIGDNRKYDTFVPEKKGIYIAKCADYFLTGEKLSNSDMLKRFNDKANVPYNNEKWDY